MRRANHFRIADGENITRSTGSTLAIGACSCLVVTIRSRFLVTNLSLGTNRRVLAILRSAVGMISAVIALFCYRADVGRAVMDMGDEDPVMFLVSPLHSTYRPALNEAQQRRGIMMPLPPVFLACEIVAFITAIASYSFRGFTVTSPGTIKQPFTDYTH